MKKGNRSKMIDDVDDLHKKLNEAGITDEEILSVKTAQKMKNVRKAIEARLNAPYSGTLREAKGELDRLTMMVEAMMLLDTLRFTLIIKKSVRS